MSEQSENLELTALEAALRELQPRAETFDHAVLMYRAGRASVRGWLWPAATLVSAAAALVLGIALWLRPAPPVTYVAVPAPPNDDTPASLPATPLADQGERGAWSRYVHLLAQVSLDDLDGLPSPPDAPEEPPLDAETLLKQL